MTRPTEGVPLADAEDPERMVLVPRIAAMAVLLLGGDAPRELREELLTALADNPPTRTVADALLGVRAPTDDGDSAAREKAEHDNNVAQAVAPLVIAATERDVAQVVAAMLEVCTVVAPEQQALVFMMRRVDDGWVLQMGARGDAEDLNIGMDYVREQIAKPGMRPN